MKKIYCINNECPFNSCKKHLKHCRAKKRKVWVANYDGVCKKYIEWLLDKVHAEMFAQFMFTNTDAEKIFYFKSKNEFWIVIPCINYYTLKEYIHTEQEGKKKVRITSECIYVLEEQIIYEEMPKPDFVFENKNKGECNGRGFN